jgi:hypothetical protein
MSTYYNYYIGYIHENKIYPLGPYTKYNELCSILESSRSAGSDLPQMFAPIEFNMMSKAFKETFNVNDEDEKDSWIYNFLPIDWLPKETYWIRGYCLIDDVMNYIHAKENGDDVSFIEEDLICNCLNPIEYAEKMRNQFMANNDENNGFAWDEDKDYSAKDYMFFSFPHTHSKEYDSAQIMQFALVLYEGHLQENLKLNFEDLVVIMIVS